MSQLTYTNQTPPGPTLPMPRQSAPLNLLLPDSPTTNPIRPLKHWGNQKMSFCGTLGNVNGQSTRILLPSRNGTRQTSRSVLSCQHFSRIMARTRYGGFIKLSTTQSNYELLDYVHEFIGSFSRTSPAALLSGHTLQAHPSAGEGNDRCRIIEVSHLPASRSPSPTNSSTLKVQVSEQLQPYVNNHEDLFHPILTRHFGIDASEC